MTDDRDLPPRMHPDDLAALERAMREGPVRVPTRPDSDVPTGVDARLLEAVISSKIAPFLTSEQIEGRTARQIVEAFKSVGLLIDEDHVEETGAAIRAVLKWYKRWDKVIGGMIIAALGAMLTAVLHLAGFSWPTSGSGVDR